LGIIGGVMRFSAYFCQAYLMAGRWLRALAGGRVLRVVCP